MPDSRAINQDSNMTVRSALVKAFETWKTPFDIKPDGVFGSVASININGVSVSSDEFDVEFTVNFDDDMEANEASITVYNLADSRIKQFKKKAPVSITAGFKGDTGLIFSGFVTKVQTRHDGADKVTTIKALDDIKEHNVESLAFAANTKASAILKTLIDKTGIPVAVFKTRRDHTYTDSETVDGDLMENIKKYAEVCGISVYVNKGKIYARYIKEGDNLSFTVNADHGMIGSPAPYTEEVKAADFKDTINGYEVEMSLQHRLSAGAIVNLSSRDAKGTFRVCSGKHRFSIYEAVTTAKMY